MFKKSKLR